MDLPSFKIGYRLKRLQETSKVLRIKTHQLLMALKKTQEEVGYTDAIKVCVSLKHFQTARSIEEVTLELDKAEEELLDLAQNIIGLMTISKSDD
jgi:hypothetical protein